ncbi:RINT1 TIP1 domain containing protein [Trichuris trichiura]|uniref:RINT1 TIP1 domain containing protein n=1 Tax=Trichuris trichiura TaxID=36087 RepID=A0A077Z2D0_TRITR|nr:RINT1 TIP1 domain containing protein [Trichuris trichiura]
MLFESVMNDEYDDYEDDLESAFRRFISVESLTLEEQITAQKTLNRIRDDLASRLTALNSKIQKLEMQRTQLQKPPPELNSSAEEFISEVEEFEKGVCSYAYSEIIAKMQNFSSSISRLIAECQWEEATNTLVELTSFSENFEKSKCRNLYAWMNKLVTSWRQLFVNVAEIVISEAIESLGYIYFEHETKAMGQLADKAPILRRCTIFLTALHVCDRRDALAAMLCKPFAKRFVFFFGQDEKHDADSKAAYYLSFILTWFVQSKQWIGELLESVEDIYSPDNVRQEYGQSMVELAKKRLSQDLQLAICDSCHADTFAELVDEMLAFDTDMFSSGYSSSSVGCMELLAEDEVFKFWSDLEQNELRAFSRQLFTRPDAWCPHFSISGEEDEHKVSYCADRFLVAMSALTNRFNAVQNFKRRIQMAHLQYSLFDDFRDQLMAFARASAEEGRQVHFEIANAASHLSHVLFHWQDHAIYMQLEIGIFDELIRQFESLRDKLLCAVASAKVHQLTESLRNELLPAIEEKQEDNFEAIITTTIVHPTQEMLTEAQQRLSTSNFAIWLKVLMKECENALIDKFILTVHCDQRVGAKLKFAFPQFFSLFTHACDGIEHPILGNMTLECFQRLMQCLSLLSSNVATCALLKEHVTLFNTETSEDHWVAVLNEMKLHLLNRDIVKKIVFNRTDVL